MIVSSRTGWQTQLTLLSRRGEVQAGIPVSTAGSATAQTGATIGPGKIL